jgi:hypothetical protein
MSKIAFCFLIVDKIHNQKLWEKFFQGVDENKYSIYIHFKKNLYLGNFNKYKLKNCVPTKWGDASLIHAHNRLITEAYKDKENKKFINLSGNCIPLKNFDHIYELLIKDDKGYVATIIESNCFPRCNALLKHYPRETIRKSSNWFILNRNLVNKLCFKDKKEINAIYGSINSPEEHYYITEINHQNLLDEIVQTPGGENDTTFTNWGGSYYKYGKGVVCKKHPKLYVEITKEEYEYLKSSYCLFGRKFIDKFLVLDKPRAMCSIQ